MGMPTISLSTTAARVVVRSRLPRASALLPAPYASHSRSFTTTARHHHHHPCWSPTSPTSRTTINNSYTSPLVNRLTSRNMASTSSANAANGNGTAASAPVDVDLSEMEYDPVQLELMNEELIVTDTDDNPIGKESKKTCHLMANILPPQSLLHRAFSVFLFRPSDGRLLLQKRASEKITFPDMWTNTCCSHPLGIPGEGGVELEEAIAGVKNAAIRKLDHELGIPAAQVPFEKFKFLTRIHYKAPSDGKWGEHEIDYILFIKANVDLKPNLNEVQDTKS